MFCTQCGQQTHDGAKFCAGCGAPLGGGAAANVAVAVGAPVHAGFWRRVAAGLTDAVIAGTLCAPLVVYEQLNTDTTGFHVLIDPIVAGLAGPPLIFILVSVLGEGVWQTTPGKFLAGIKVTDSEGEKIGLGAAALRMGGKLAVMLTLGGGVVMAAFTARRRALDDMAAGTLVVSRSASVADIGRASVSEAMPVTRSVVIMMVLAASAVLAVPIAMGAAWDALREPAYAPDGIREHIKDMGDYYGTVRTEDGTEIEASAPGPGGGAKGDTP